MIYMTIGSIGADYYYFFKSYTYNVQPRSYLCSLCHMKVTYLASVKFQVAQFSHFEDDLICAHKIAIFLALNYNNLKCK